MANKIPFTAYAKITPERGDGKRFEIQRSRERIANLIYGDLTANFAGNIATPGGTGTWSLSEDAASLADSVNTVAVKPQFGQDPDMVTIVGFYDGDATVAPYPESSFVHAGQFVSGPAGAPGWRDTLQPTTNTNDEVKALKTALESAVTSLSLDIIKIEYAGITYGRGGYHFPR